MKENEISVKMKERNLFPSGTFKTLLCKPAGSTSVQLASQFNNSPKRLSFGKVTSNLDAPALGYNGESRVLRSRLGVN